MVVALEQFVKQLEDSGILNAETLKDFIPPKASPKNSEDLAQRLIKAGKITTFQAQHGLAGKTKALVLGNYTILDKIGAGGMGQVFKAEHRRMKRVVAVKMLPPAVTRDAAAVARFHREMEAAARLSHPNIVAAFDAAEANDAHFLVMEYVEGSDLSALVKKNGPFPVAKAVNYILQAARGLEFAHAEGVIHRDIKPSNLLLDKNGMVKILDMGLARIEQPGAAQSELTGTGAVLGTVDYMSPEQAFNTKYADARADIYSLGCSLYYLMAGKPLYAGETAIEKILAHREKPIPSLCDANLEVPAELDAVFQKMVAKQVLDRYQTMSEVVADLENCQAGMSAPSTVGRRSDASVESDLSIAFADAFSPAPPSTSESERASSVRQRRAAGNEGPPWKNNKVLIGAGVAAAFLAIVLGAIVMVRNRGGEEIAGVELAPGAAVKVRRGPDSNRSSLGPEKAVAATGDPLEPLDLLARVDLERDASGDGKWTRAEGVLLTPVANRAVLKLFTPDPIPREYDVELVVERKSRQPGGIALGFVSSGNQATVSMEAGFNAARPAWYIEQIGGKPGVENGTLKYAALLPANQPKTVLIQVRSRGVTTLVDGAPVLQWQGQPEQLSLGEWTPDSGHSLFLGSKTAMLVHKLTLTPAGISRTAWSADPAYRQQWIADTQKLPADKQIEAVRQKLMALNPGFDGKLGGEIRWIQPGPVGVNDYPTIENGVVVGVALVCDNVRDISPVRVFAGLKFFGCFGSGGDKGRLADLSPLAGMRLASFRCLYSEISDLSALAGMPLTDLGLTGTRVHDLSPLRGMPLKNLNSNGSRQIADLSPLAGMPLETLSCQNAQVRDFSPLEKCKNLRDVCLYYTAATAAQAAALQKALPNCKIVWGEPPKAMTAAPAPAGKQ